MKNIIFISLIFSINIFSQDNIKYSKTILKKDLEKHLTIIASDSLEGRETGKKGQKIAAEYLKYARDRLENVLGISI